LVAGFLPLDKGKVNEVHEGFAVSGEEGHFFLLFAKQFTGISNLCFAKIFGHR
jgi:hypothetical protein